MKRVNKRREERVAAGGPLYSDEEDEQEDVQDPTDEFEAKKAAKAAALAKAQPAAGATDTSPLVAMANKEADESLI